jgi:hypothetical protein
LIISFSRPRNRKAGARPGRASTRRSVASDNITSAGWRAKLTSARSDEEVEARSRRNETRRRIVKTAAAEFRRNGIHDTGLSGVMSAAGLTHGGFYRHFDSKDELVAEACAAATEPAAENTVASACYGAANASLEAIVTSYLCPDHRDNL